MSEKRKRRREKWKKYGSRGGMKKIGRKDGMEKVEE